VSLRVRGKCGEVDLFGQGSARFRFPFIALVNMIQHEIRIRVNRLILVSRCLIVASVA
jgi:hypothetical protein